MFIWKINCYHPVSGADRVTYVRADTANKACEHFAACDRVGYVIVGVTPEVA